MDKLSLADEFPAVDEAAWMTLVEKALRGADFERTLVSRTYDDLKLDPLYTGNDDARQSGLPGSAPYARGFRAAHGEQPWDIRQLYTATDPAAANKEILDDLMGGVTSMALQIAGPGQFGVKVETLADLERTLDGVQLDFAPLTLIPGERFGELMDMLDALIGKKGHEATKIAIALNADPLGTLARTGAASDNLDTTFERLGTVLRRARDSYPAMTTILVDGRPYHDGGASEAQELACLCATMVAYLRALEGDGLTPADILDQMAFAISADTDQFLTIAKLRAARMLVARIAEECGAAPSLPGVKFQVETSRRMLASQDPWVNILRTTMACAGAALGGADSITVLPFTWALGQPDAFARRIARNVQIILQEESALGAVLDPAGGSWYVETLSRNLATKAWEQFQEIEKQGGITEACANSFIQNNIAKTAAKRAEAVATGQDELTGVSVFPALGDTPVSPEPHPLADEIEDPAITVEPIPLRAPSEPFDRLRQAASAYSEDKDSRPAVFLANLGKTSDFAARATFARNFFAAGGLDAINSSGDGTPESVTENFAKSGAKLACLCSSDAVYDECAVEAAASLKKAGAEHIYLAGRPGDARTELREAGVGTFLHKGCDMIEILTHAHGALGVKAL